MSSKRGLTTGLGVAVATALILAVAFGAFSSSHRSAAGQGGRTVGIVVKGAWTIEVRSPGGRLAGRRSFENALLPTGATALVGVVSRTNLVGMWQLSLLPAGLFDPNLFCNIRESTSTGAPPVVAAKTLTVSTPTTGPDAAKLVLAGTVVAKSAGSVTQVQSAVFTPDATTGTLGSETGTLRQFTRAVLPTPIAVAAGQEISITVRFSFT
jgi:hypothetical protein